MKRYKVIVELADTNGKNFIKEYIIEAGNKKTAYIRAASRASEDGYLDYYKTIKSCEEIKEN